MVPLLRILYFLIFFFVFSSCKSTCEKAVEKTIACAPSSGLKSELRQKRDLALLVCSPHEDQVEKCIKLHDCIEFHRCMKQAVVFRESPRKRSDSTPANEPQNMEKETTPSEEPASP